ncbi:MAG: hypothetical protein ACJ790_16185 [Myxococcaceae bacterium]
MPKQFLPQNMLEDWALNDQADLKEGKLVFASDRASFVVSPAVHFQKLATGADEQKLLDKVKTVSQLEKLGAEHMADSVILGDTAYEVASGYVVDVPGKAPDTKKKSNPEADLLADFLLNKL